MALKISASSLFSNHYLIVKPKGIRFCETSFGGSVRRFRFGDIHCVLMSEKNTLSFQVGKEVFSIPTKPDKEKHQKAIAMLVHEVLRANGMAGFDGTPGA